jgi:putative FmdB family regulatory protein
MPLFDYTCQSCETKREMLCRHDAATVVKCPNCGDRTMTRDTIQSAPIVLFKGTGWPGQDGKLNDKLKRGEIASVKP